MNSKRKAKRFQPRQKHEVKLPPITQKGFGTEMPPEYPLVAIYFDQKEAPNQAAAFFKYYEDVNWTRPRGSHYRNWKVLAADWIYNYQQQLKLEKRLRRSHL